MKKFVRAKITENIEIAKDIYSMRLEAPQISKVCKAGQFVELYIGRGENILPRPISICDANGDELRVIFAKAGSGTAWLANLGDVLTVSTSPEDAVKSSASAELDVMGPLGNGFTLCENKKVAIVGGGVGVPPLYMLAKNLARKNNALEVFLGFREESILAEDFAKLGAKVHVATDNGAEGFKGNAVELLAASGFAPEIIYACGPKPMLKSIKAYAKERQTECYVSMEERMACGIGACVGCVIDTVDANGQSARKKVCADGPVFDAKEVVFS